MRVPELPRIYVAGWFNAKDRLIVVRDLIHKNGLGEVVGTWLDEEVAAPADPAMAVGAGSTLTPSEARMYALRDLAEIEESELLILDTLDVNPRGGREVEFGIAMARGLGLWIVGPRRNVFHYLAHRQFDTWEAALGALAANRQEDAVR